MSYLIYEGPSMLDGSPIFAALTGVDRPSANAKTGPMAQVWVMRADMNPMDAIKANADRSVCGTCPLRGNEGKGRSCYVTLHQAPNQVFKVRDKLKPISPLIYRNRAVRLGAYGDMAALPTSVTKEIVRRSVMTTGYTHQWRTCDQELSKYLMASVETEEDRALAKSMGWSTFRIKAEGQPKLKGETLCPASEEAGKRMTCFTCGKCCGNKAKDVVITVHGTGKNHFNRLLRRHDE